MAVQVNSTKYSKNININPLEFFQKTEEEETLPNSFYEASITLILKPETLPEKKKVTDQYL